jgi:hypothetical protein
MSDPTVGNHPLSAAMAEAQGMRTDGSDSAGDGSDHFLHAAGRICKKCEKRIEARQPARRKGEDGWVRDACPPAFD